jgi:REP element-mobilizing transposase RayT
VHARNCFTGLVRIQSHRLSWFSLRCSFNFVLRRGRRILLVYRSQQSEGSHPDVEYGEIRGQTGRSPFSPPKTGMGRIPPARDGAEIPRESSPFCYFLTMARFPRVVVVDVPHHVTQRGNARQVILTDDAGRVAYLELLRQYSEHHRLSLLGYCLMSNHVHLIVVARTAEALAQTLKHTHRYASYWNAQNSSSGHVWQGRFYSCPLDETHLWRALRYVGIESRARRHGDRG